MKEIVHDGIVESIGSDGHIRVRITQLAACAACKVAGHCNASEQRVKVVEVCLPGSGRADGGGQASSSGCSFSVGDSVVVSTSQAAAGRALLLGFGMPLFLLLVALAAMLMFGNDEGTSALVAIAILLPYYLILWLCRDRIAGSISFRITSTNK